ncbi:porin [Bradyrhizobium liaoningense]|uniref:porin n=1 Tax=Bradyrhizobium liaoningense TaxID=43992 RepID=UPI003908AF39
MRLMRPIAASSRRIRSRSTAAARGDRRTLLDDRPERSAREGERRRRWPSDGLYARAHWYVNGNVRFMLDYLHGTVSRQASPVSTADVGSKFDAVALRSQFAF